jgi:hypothetical protein
MKNRIVMYHYYSIARRMDVELDRVRTQRERAFKCRYRVFGEGVVGAAVRYPEWGEAAWRQRNSGKWALKGRTYETWGFRSIALNELPCNASTGRG